MTALELLAAARGLLIKQAVESLNPPPYPERGGQRGIAPQGAGAKPFVTGGPKFFGAQHQGYNPSTSFLGSMIAKHGYKPGPQTGPAKQWFNMALQSAAGRPQGQAYYGDKPRVPEYTLGGVGRKSPTTFGETGQPGAVPGRASDPSVWEPDIEEHAQQAPPAVATPLRRINSLVGGLEGTAGAEKLPSF
jgi:hypothetical protein